MPVALDGELPDELVDAIVDELANEEPRINFRAVDPLGQGDHPVVAYFRDDEGHTIVIRNRADVA